MYTTNLNVKLGRELYILIMDQNSLVQAVITYLTEEDTRWTH